MEQARLLHFYKDDNGKWRLLQHPNKALPVAACHVAGTPTSLLELEHSNDFMTYLTSALRNINEPGGFECGNPDNLILVNRRIYEIGKEYEGETENLVTACVNVIVVKEGVSDWIME
ncbi:MAG: hypothetical protein Q9181_001656 [Wetmoreana brouardii]